jgi:hypothetical protein
MHFEINIVNAKLRVTIQHKRKARTTLTDNPGAISPEACKTTIYKRRILW